jgi:nucleoside-diphosphate-sugar epimerase
MHRVLITGAGGFLGRHCLVRLAGTRCEVHGVVRPGREFAFPGARIHRADLLDPAQVAALLAAVRPSHLLHLAWVTTPGTYWTSPENAAWVAAGLHLILRFVACGGRRVVSAGSCAEYDWSEGPCSEATTPLRPASPYGVCKNSLRQALDAVAAETGVSAAWARIFFLYGPHEHPRRLVPSVARALLRGEPAPCFAGAQRCDFLHVLDAAAALLALLESGVCGPVNVGSGEAVPVREVIRHLAAHAGRPELATVGAASEAAEARQVVADVRRLREELGWTPQIALRRGLADTLAWWRSRVADKRLTA